MIRNISRKGKIFEVVVCALALGVEVCHDGHQVVDEVWVTTDGEVNFLFVVELGDLVVCLEGGNHEVDL